jgi:glycosyltransferase involved in cell wall biosynthesis
MVNLVIIQNHIIITARTQPVKVILNVDAITQPLTGIGQYTLQLARQLTEAPGVEQLRCFSATRWVDPPALGGDVNPWLGRLKQWIPFKGLALNAYARRRDRCFSRLTGDLTDHVFHSPNFILMPFAGRSVATFHDLSFVHHRETQPAYRLRFLDQHIPKTLEQAAALITPSAFVKQEIIDHYGVPTERIQVTPLGVDPGFKPLSVAQVQPHLVPFGLLHKQFLLSVATTEPRKNLSRLLTAYGRLPASLRDRLPLVLVGSKGWLNQDLNRQLRHLVSAGQVISTGYLPEASLRALYAAAKLTVFPSLYEGFGLPIIESMASGTPVLTSDHSAMAEVAAGHARLCDPNDTDDLFLQLLAAIEDDQWLNDASQSGLSHARSFTWQSCAEATLKAYAQ